MNASIYKKYDATFERQIATARQELENLNLDETIDFHFKRVRANTKYMLCPKLYFYLSL